MRRSKYFFFHSHFFVRQMSVTILTYMLFQADSKSFAIECFTDELINDILFVIDSSSLTTSSMITS
jgi:hypothetical protein